MNRLYNGSWRFLRLFIYLYSFILNIVLLEIFFLFTHFQPQTYISIYIKEDVKMSICNLLTFERYIGHENRLYHWICKGSGMVLRLTRSSQFQEGVSKLRLCGEGGEFFLNKLSSFFYIGGFLQTECSNFPVNLAGI